MPSTVTSADTSTAFVPPPPLLLLSPPLVATSTTARIPTITMPMITAGNTQPLPVRFTAGPGFFGPGFLPGRLVVFVVTS